MELNLSDIIKERIKQFDQNPQNYLKVKGKEYQKNWNAGVNYFMLEINKDRKKENLPPIPFIAVRQKLIALKEIDDLRFFYNQCLKYSRTKDKNTGKRNTFSKCFFGALKIE